MSLASTSIAKQCYNDNSSYASSKKSNNKYLTYMIVMGVIGILVAGGVMYGGMHAKPVSCTPGLVNVPPLNIKPVQT
jgi:hypothetical protein